MPFGWGESEDAYKQVQDDDQNTGSFSHEAIAGAASFGAFKMYEDKQRKDGQPVDHQFAKEALVGLAGGLVDKLVETKGMDLYDAERAKHAAKQNVENMYDQQYGQADNYDPNNSSQHPSLDRYSGGDGGDDSNY